MTFLHEMHPLTILERLDELLASNHVSTCCCCLLRCIAVSKHCHAHELAGREGGIHRERGGHATRQAGRQDWMQ